MLGVAQEHFHLFNVWEPALASCGTFALKDFSLAIKSVAGPFALPNSDVAQLALKSTKNLQKRVLVNCDAFDMTNDLK